jgi:hypothetical protein
MDISAYYDKFQSSYNWALAAVILGIFTAVFCCVRTIIDKSDECRPIWKKVVYCIGYVLIFGFVVGLFFRGPYLMKKDIDQQSIYAYEGEFEIVELIPGYNQKAVFLLNGEKVCLVYFSDTDDYDFKISQPGKYTGKLIYGKNLSHVLYIEISPSESK